jgi:myo-inositol 2-dehydrogenase/D-chiro-inositol 1-dehydrogenase/scyllo-inositol 2-dehydrogenase (NAD+)
MARDLRVVLVGAGRAGLVHGRNLADGVRGARLVGVADPDDAAREQAATELDCDLRFADPHDAVADDCVDALVLASPTFTHAEVAVAALKAGKHVLSEKPLASTLEEAASIRDAAQASDAVFLIGFMRRFDEGFVRAKERIDAGDIGEPLLVRSTGRGPGLPPEWAWDVERSGGLVSEVNAHDLDSVRWLTGQDYTRVHALGRAAKRPDLAERYPGFLDLFTATFEMDGGAIGRVDGACPADYAYDARMEVYGSEGLLLLGDVHANDTLLVRSDGVHADRVQSWRTLFADAYRAEDAHFAAVAHGLEAARTTVDDGVAALEAAIAVNRSISQGAPIDLATVRA